MSKRGTENQITKDDYDRDEDEESSQEMGTFKKASNEELARRPMRALRRLGPRTSSNLSDDGTKRPSPFASLGASSAPSSQSSIEEPAKPANSFANFTFGVASSTAIPSTTLAPSQAGLLFKGLDQQAAISTLAESQERSSMTHGVTTATTSIPTTTSSFSRNTFTFNIGSKPSETGSETDSALNGYDPSEPLNREQYERWLRSMNQAFLKKIQKELEINPTVNLSQVFNQYMQHRMSVRKAYKGVELQETTGMQSNRKEEDVSSDDAGSVTRITRIGAGGADSPKMGFGLPFDITTNAEGKKGFSFAPPKTDSLTSVFGNSSSAAAATTAAAAAPSSPSVFSSLTSTNSSAFGSSSVKGAIDPPKNPFNFGMPFGASAVTSTTLSASSALTSAASTTPAPPFSFAPSKPFSFSSLLPAGSTAGGGAETPKPFAFATSGLTGISTGGEAPKPFGFTSSGFGGSSVGGGPKPFAFSNQLGMTGASAGGVITPPKPFAFQVSPMTASSQSSSPDATTLEEDNENGITDEPKSQFVDNREGQEDEETVFEIRARLYGVVNGENKDLGVGQFRVNENTKTRKRRMIMRTGGTGLITLNSWVIQGMPAKREKTVVTLYAIDDNKPKRFMLRVKEELAAEELFNALEAGQDQSE